MINDERPQWATHLSDLRDQKGMTQQQFAESIGVTQSDVCKMEKGTRPLGKKLARRIAETFNVDYRMFL